MIDWYNKEIHLRHWLAKPCVLKFASFFKNQKLGTCTVTEKNPIVRVIKKVPELGNTWPVTSDQLICKNVRFSQNQ